MTVRLKRSLFFTGSIVLALALLGCGGGGKYGDLKKAMNEMIDAMKGFVDSVEKASDGKGTGKALQRYVEAMEKLQPRWRSSRRNIPS